MLVGCFLYSLPVFLASYSLDTFAAVKGPEREANDSLSYTVSVKDKCSNAFAPQIRLHGVDRHTFTFLL